MRDIESIRRIGNDIEVLKWVNYNDLAETERREIDRLIEDGERVLKAGIDSIEDINARLDPELEKLLNEPIEPIDIDIEIIDLDRY